MNLAVGLWSLEIKSDHLKMPRPCAVEFHVCDYNNSGSLEDATDLTHWYLHNFRLVNPTTGRWWMVQSQPTGHIRILLNPTTGRWWMVQSRPLFSVVERAGRD